MTTTMTSIKKRRGFQLRITKTQAQKPDIHLVPYTPRSYSYMKNMINVIKLRRLEYLDFTRI